MSNSEEQKSRIRYVRMKDVLSCLVFIIIAPIALIAKVFIHDFWLVGEEKCEARDNGYWFFKFVRENYPKQKIAYVIDKRCPDYSKVKDLGKVIQWGGIKHWFWYLTAKKNISSQKGCKPNAAACFLFEVKLRLWRNKRYFLQHGITKDNVEWLYYNNCRFKMFACGAKPEYDYIRANFGYPDERVRYVGFCRFDGLHDAQPQKGLILVMPTWRSYIIRQHGTVTNHDLEKQFTSTEYFQKWSEFLTSDKLAVMLKNKGCKLLFYPHRNMQTYLDKFKELEVCENIEIADPSAISVQQALKDAECLVTDYSSVFFDFAYMKKPILFYQFDEAEFRANQYSEGYFDYHDNTLGKWCGTLDECLSLLDSEMESGFAANDRITEFFELYDKDNCKRNYDAVREL